jgi:VanZ family protein
MKKQKLQLIISWFAVFLWMIFIFLLSSQTAQASDRVSRAVTSIIVKLMGLFRQITLETSTAQNWFNLMNNTVREYAHGTIYFILIILVCNAFSKSGVGGWKLYMFSFIFCAAYAVSDELHQLFVAGRGAEVKDFMTDCIGALMGIALYGIITWNFRIGNLRIHR